MGFIIKYNRFFSVLMKDDGSGKAIEGFRFLPTCECRRQLNNYNLVFRSRSSGFEVFYSRTPLIEITKKVRFTVGFTIPDPGLFEKYGLIKKDPSDPTVYQPGLSFDNLDAGGSIIIGMSDPENPPGISSAETVTAADTARIYRQTFKVYDPTAGPIPSSYDLAHKYTPALTQGIPVAAGAITEYIVTTINSIDREADYIRESGPYVLQPNVNPPPDRNVYLDNELGKKSVQGVVDIYWETAQDTVADPAKGQQYTITFKPK